MPAFLFRGGGKITRKRSHSRKEKRRHKKQRGRAEVVNKAIEILSPLPLAFTESASWYFVKKSSVKINKEKTC